MNGLRQMARQRAPWLTGNAPQREIVLSSRVRLARNVQGWRFPHATPADELCGLRDQILAAAEEVAGLASARVLHMEDLEEIERRFLLERHLISADLVRFVLGRSLLLSAGEAQGMMINEEDHVRLQSFAPGLALDAALERSEAMVCALDERLGFAYDDRLGFLTACPTNVGTGMRASVLVHLPGLVITGDVERVLNSLRRLDFTVRGFYGEGSGVMGALFQISNSATLGRTEQGIAEELVDHAQKVIECERRAREALLEHDRMRLEDRVGRSWGVLRHGRLLSTKEAFERLSDVRLGASLGVLPRLDDAVLNTLLINVQSAHLQVGEGLEMQAPERDELRATHVREQLREAEERNEGR